mmetsp:Transcript_32612/g.51962  ORF Transcript_32612/g.51962 Transcript_32612/m.51962 type:complete len:1085 (+) Transcript_32612:389-3643(+)|eukprot:CAMPEP_0203765478 /NCGR_PEP_ID=MMETSP0098-20131031/18436_1 /ASSEMBLY_ACC=CAM_ASM_000208 /TAXON_ID=96639 /ORGANISM=" , Strain NY0313808BC1" /LENGTH=1084 /DNA_ID=CAMNT_0050661735 /DNA_START=341 /DNA_END=3595 /DNA_ORIENTATION=+
MNFNWCFTWPLGICFLVASCLVVCGKEINWQGYTGEAEAIRLLENYLKALEEECITFETGGWWKYRWCHKNGIRQYHDERNGKIVVEWSTGEYLGRVSLGATIQPGANRGAPSYLSYRYVNGQKCVETGAGRTTEVRIQCCSSSKRFNVKSLSGKVSDLASITSVAEVKQCSYLFLVCSPVLCSLPSIWASVQSPLTEGAGGDSQLQSEVAENVDEDGEDEKWTVKHDSNDDVETGIDDIEEDKPISMSDSEKDDLGERVRDMFYHGYDAYMMYAFPFDELKPLTCSGEDFDLTAGNMLSLVDSLDMLVILGNYSEFARVVQIVESRLSFDEDTTVSVFETTIRVLGGLLSAHMFATDGDIMPEYTGGLLPLAQDLGERLLPAFNTSTSIPYGTVNLRHGVPKGETTEACTAAAGSLSIEFGMLSVLTGEPKFGIAARDALRSIYDHRSKLGLVGRHIDVMSGRWTEPTAGIGSNIDSLYEYYIKHYILFGDEAAFDMFIDLYESAVRHLRIDDTWYIEADMHRGNIQRRQFNNLQAFWPGMQTLVGDFDAASRTLNAFLKVWNEFGFTPEDFSIDRWSPLQGGTKRGYPLRPELAESVYYMQLATGDDSWFFAGKDIVESLEATCRVDCGFASIKDIKTKVLHDIMPSFFLSELLKYLFLLFDKDNFLRNEDDGGYVFTTEAHPFPVRSWIQIAAQNMEFSESPARRDRVRKKQVEKDSGDLPWGVPSLARPMKRERMCATVEDLSSPHRYYAADPTARTPRFPGYEPGPGKVRLPKKRSVSPEPALPPETTAEYGTPEILTVGLGKNKRTYAVIANEGGFEVLQMDSDAKVELITLGGAIMNVRLSDKHSREKYIFLDLGKSSFGTECFVDFFSERASEQVCPTVTFPNMVVEAPQSKIATRTACSFSEFGAPPFTPRSFQGSIVLADTKTGCNKDSFKSSSVEGNIVLLERGDCMFEEKAKYAEAAGAKGVIISQNKDDEGLFYMVGMTLSSWFKSAGSNIPAYMISKEQGNLLREQISKQADDESMFASFTIRSTSNTGSEFPWAAVYQTKLVVMVSFEWGVQLTMEKEGDKWAIAVIQP